MELDLEELAAIVELLKDAEFTEFRLHKGDLSLVVTRGGAVSTESVVSAVSVRRQPTTATAPASTRSVSSPPASATSNTRPVAKVAPPRSRAFSPDDLDDDEVLIITPMLGTFYRSPKPGEPPFVEVGDKIDADAVVGIVEVMKLMSSITSGVTGELSKIFAQDGQLVEADQPLYAVRTTQ